MKKQKNDNSVILVIIINPPLCNEWSNACVWIIGTYFWPCHCHIVAVDYATVEIFTFHHRKIGNRRISHCLATSYIHVIKIALRLLLFLYFSVEKNVQKWSGDQSQLSDDEKWNNSNTKQQHDTTMTINYTCFCAVFYVNSKKMCLILWATTKKSNTQAIVHMWMRSLKIDFCQTNKKTFDQQTGHSNVIDEKRKMNDNLSIFCLVQNW